MRRCLWCSYPFVVKLPTRTDDRVSGSGPCSPSVLCSTALCALFSPFLSRASPVRAEARSSWRQQPTRNKMMRRGRRHEGRQERRREARRLREERQGSRGDARRGWHGRGKAAGPTLRDGAASAMRRGGARGRARWIGCRRPQPSPGLPQASVAGAASAPLAGRHGRGVQSSAAAADRARAKLAGRCGPCTAWSQRSP